MVAAKAFRFLIFGLKQRGSDLVYSFSESSEKRLQTCHVDLRFIANAAIQKSDFSVLCGHRNKAAQERAFAEGNSLAHWGESRHNASGDDPTMSDAFDLAPYPIIWPEKKTDLPLVYIRNFKRFIDLAFLILTIAEAHGIDLRWGGQFIGLDDWGHFELA